MTEAALAAATGVNYVMGEWENACMAGNVCGGMSAPASAPPTFSSGWTLTKVVTETITPTITALSTVIPTFNDSYLGCLRYPINYEYYLIWTIFEPSFNA